MNQLATIPPPPGNVIELGPLTIHYYGILIAAGVMVAIVVARRRYAARGGTADLVDQVALWGVIAGLVGARLAWVSTNLDQIAQRPLSAFAIWEGGLAFFGGVTLGVIVGIVVLRRHNADLPSFFDAAAPAIPLAQAIGRWGNYFNQELFGTSTSLPWALEIERGGQIVDTVHPTFLYESLANLVLALLLIWLGRRGVVRRGGLLFAYAIGYGVVRFANEQLRIDSNWEPLGMAINAWVALGVAIAGAAALIWWQRRDTPEHPHAEPAGEQAEGGSPDRADRADRSEPASGSDD